MSLIAQAKLLRVLEERRFERLGGNKSISVDFRLISATNRPLEQFVRDGRFREDLYYRVNAFAIRLPSLRERQVDIPVLAQRFLARYCAAQGLPLDSKAFSREALDLLRQLPLAGQHPRARKHRLARGAVGAGPHRSAPPTSSSCTRRRRRRRRRAIGMPSLAEAERAHIVRVLEAVQWNKKEAARVLDISRGTLYRKIVEYQLEPEPRPAGRRSREARRRAERLHRFASTVVRAFGFRPSRSHDEGASGRGAALRRRRARRGAAVVRASSRRTQSTNPVLFVVLLVCSSLASAFKVNLPLASSGSTMSVSYAVDFASLLLLGAERDDDRRRGQRVEPVHVPDAGAIAAAPHAVQHGVAGAHREGGRLGLHAARRPATGHAVHAR